MVVVQSCPTLCDPWTVARQDPLSMEFFRQYWSGLPFLPPVGHKHELGQIPGDSEG